MLNFSQLLLGFFFYSVVRKGREKTGQNHWGRRMKHTCRIVPESFLEAQTRSGARKLFKDKCVKFRYFPNLEVLSKAVPDQRLSRFRWSL